MATPQIKISSNPDKFTGTESYLKKATDPDFLSKEILPLNMTEPAIMMAVFNRITELNTERMAKIEAEKIALQQKLEAKGSRSKPSTKASQVGDLLISALSKIEIPRDSLNEMQLKSILTLSQYGISELGLQFDPAMFTCLQDVTLQINDLQPDQEDLINAFSDVLAKKISNNRTSLWLSAINNPFVTKGNSWFSEKKGEDGKKFDEYVSFKQEQDGKLVDADLKVIKDLAVKFPQGFIKDKKIVADMLGRSDKTHSMHGKDGVQYLVRTSLRDSAGQIIYALDTFKSKESAK